MSEPAILQVIPALDTGGAERTTIDVAAALAAQGFVPLVASAGGRMEAELATAGGQLIHMNAAAKAPHKLVANANFLRGVILKHNVKLVHARSRAPAWSALFAARLAGIPFITTYHGIYNASNPLKRFYNSVMTRGDAVIANSKWTADHIAREYRGRTMRLAVIPRGVDLSRLDPAGVGPGRIADLRKSWDVAESDFVVLLPGRLTRWKGQSLLIEAMTQLHRNNNVRSIRAIFAGDAQGRDAYADELRRKIGAAGLTDVIKIVGHIGDMATAYAASDVVVSASTDPEAFGRVAAEASAMQRPVIAADHGGARETIVTNVTGLLFMPGSADELAKTIFDISEMTEDRRAMMGRAGRAHIANNYSCERMCADTIALYRELLAR